MKKKETKEFDREREFSVILEKIYGEMKTLAEGQDDLRSKFDMLFKEFGRQKEEIFIIKADIRAIKEDIVVMKKDIVEMKKDIVEMKKDIVEIKESVKSHERRLSLQESS